MSKLFGLNKPNTNLRKNVFDLSEKNLYSSSVGLLTPLLCRELNPGEKVQVSVNALTRSMPMNSAAFVRSRQYFHYFFVPFRQLWSGWDNFINSVDYKTSSFQKDAIYSRIPGIDLFKSIADLLEDGYLTPAFNPATKQIEVPENLTIRDNTTSYKFRPGNVRGDGNFVADERIDKIRKLLASGRKLSADDQKYYDEYIANQNKPATPVVKPKSVVKKTWSDLLNEFHDYKDSGKYIQDVNENLFFSDLDFIMASNIKFDGGDALSNPEDVNVYQMLPDLVNSHGLPAQFNAIVVSASAVKSHYIYIGNKYIELQKGQGIINYGMNLYLYDSATNTMLGYLPSYMDAHGIKFDDREAIFPIADNGTKYVCTNDTSLAYWFRMKYADLDVYLIQKFIEDIKNPPADDPAVNNSTIPASQGKSISFSTDAVNKTLDEQGYSYITGISRLLDMLEYGFSYVEFDEETQSYTQKASTLVDLIDSLSKKKINVLEWLRSEKNKCVVNPFRLLAYQKIYSDFYKRDDYEATNPLHWNIDDFKRGSAVMDFDDNSRLLNMLRLRYRWHNKDYFTGVVPSELLGGLQGFNANSLGMFGDNMQINSDDNKVSVGSGNVSTKGIRAMFALEKLMRLTRRAGGFDYISQTLAHYGFEPPRGRGDKVEFVGGTANNINISEVVSTADTAKGFTGQIYGRGIGSIDEKGNTEFTAKEHGLLMCIASIVPDSDYSAEGLNSFNSKLQRGDYFQPEFQDLGLQPVFNYELYNRIYADNMPENIRINKGVFGFAPRYAEYKSAFDKLHGEFRNGRNMSMWSSVSNVTDTNQGVARNSLKINPGVFNRIFAEVYNGHESTDQFLTSAQFECKIIRPMSVTGQNL